jgi:hypothetical protein
MTSDVTMRTSWNAVRPARSVVSKAVSNPLCRLSLCLAAVSLCASVASADDVEAPAASARIEVNIDTAARCSLDGGNVVEVVAGTPKWFETTPGPHTLTCATDDKRKKTNLALSPAEVRAITIAFLDPPPLLIEEPPLLPVDPPANENAQKPVTLRVSAEGTSRWTCRIEDTPPLTPDSSGVLVAQLPPGKHEVLCERPGFLPFKTVVEGRSGETLSVQATFQARAAPPLAPAVEEKPAPPPPPRAYDLAFSAGFGPSNGLFGVGIGGRVGRWGLSMGSGAYPFGASLLHYFGAGKTGFYLSAGYLRIGRGLVAGGSNASGHELFATAGIDVRLQSKLGVRIGLGGGYKFGWDKADGVSGQHGDGRGPVVFDFALTYAL